MSCMPSAGVDSADVPGQLKNLTFGESLGHEKPLHQGQPVGSEGQIDRRHAGPTGG